MKAIMGRKKKTPDGSKSWEERKAKFAGIQIHRDIATIAGTLARHQKISVAELLEPLLREPLMAMWKDFGSQIVEGQDE